MYQNQFKAYDAMHRESQDGRKLEASVLLRAARKLKECQDRWNEEDQEARLQEAIRFDQMIWSIFQGELAREDNPLPPELKRNLLALSAYIDRTIFETMANPAPEKLSVLIRINQQIAAGLMTSPNE